ncbi:MAG: DUF692 family protein [Pseudomonadota bacterium]|nr:DUF692 family protein [Pseudomonadota bacterium]QKK05541.1 MAG: DUF692 family protein [Pseudomonadota bacterium]
MTYETVRTGIAFFPNDAARPVYQQLIDTGHVAALEWTVDTQSITAADQKILQSYAEKQSLVGHGVHYSVLSVGGEKQRRTWLERLKTCPWTAHYTQLSVHFGFSSGWIFKYGAPLPVPYSQEAVAIGHKNMATLAQALPCRIGLENLALGFCRKDAENQGAFLEELLAPFQGYLLLDLHNLYCQAKNFTIELPALLKTYPLKHVEEMHISGGSWSRGSHTKNIRRDTHDHAVPDEVWDILPTALEACPNLKYIFLEQLPHTLGNKEAANAYITDYKKLVKIVKG